MKRILVTMMAAAFAMSFAACDQPATNKPANTANANAAKPAPAAPTKEALFELDKTANTAWAKGDAKWFEENLSDNFISYYEGNRMSKADEVKMIASTKCEVKTWSLEDPQMVKINDDTYVTVYKSVYDGECTVEGNKMKIPSPMRAATIWVRDGDKWKGSYHSSTMIIDPSAPPAAPAKPEAKKEEAKKEEPKKDGEAAKKDEANKPQPGANTEALTKLHNGGWEAFGKKDVKWFNDTMTDGVAIVGPMGDYHSGKANIVKLWTETMKCEGITKTSFTDTFASALSPTVELLTGKGAADGKCDGMANGDLYQAAVYVKEGDVWKMAFMFEQPAKK